MILVNTSWRMWMVGMAVSVGIFLVVYFTAIQPSTNAANQAISTGLKQTQQALNQAQQQLSGAAQQASGQSSPAASAATQVKAPAGQTGAAIPSQASQAISNAQKLAACVAAAGTNVSALTACQTKYKG
jgi:hypothetical protein